MVDIEVFESSHPHGSLVELIACGVNSREALQRLADSVTAVHSGCRCRVVKGTRLVYRSPVGFCLTIR